jgi:hypothetical protein
MNNLHKRLKKVMSRHFQSRKKYAIKRLSQFELNDPKRCERPKSYSFCGSRTTPKTHWYYNKKQNRCLPFIFCESIDLEPGMYLENNFYAQQECSAICVQT